MENTGIVFEKRKVADSCSLTYYKIAIEGDSRDCLGMIKTLLTLIGRIPDGEMTQGETYDICHLIEALLPSEEQMQQIEDMQLKKSKTA